MRTTINSSSIVVNGGRDFTPGALLSNQNVDLWVKGGTIVEKEMCVYGNINASSIVSLGGELIINGNTNLADVFIDELTVTGTCDLADVFIDDLHITGNLVVEGDSSMDGTLNVVGNTVVNNLTITGILVGGGGDVSFDGTGLESTTAGTTSTASGNYTSAYGYGATASGLNTISIGHESNASIAESILIGNGLVSTGTLGGIGIGSDARESSVAVGRNISLPSVLAKQCTIIGNNNTVNSQYGACDGHTIVGYNNLMTSIDYNTIIGSNNVMFGTEVGFGSEYNVVIGSFSGCSDYFEQVAIGYNVSTFGNQSVVIGSRSVSNYRSVTIGSESACAGSNSIAIGYDASTSSSTGCIAIGSLASASVTDSIAIGNTATASSVTNALAIRINASSVNATAPTGATTYLGVNINGVNYKILLQVP